MNAAPPPTAARPLRSSRLAPLFEALRGLGPGQLAAALVVTVLLALLRGYYLVSEYARGHNVLLQLPGTLVTGVAVVVGFVVADAYVRHGARPFLAHGTAVFTVAVGTSIAKWHLTAALGGHNWFDDDVPLAVQRTEIAFLAILLMVQVGFGTAAYLQWRASGASSLRLRASELQRAKTERHMRQTQLLAMQARIEPELLFGTLQRVGELSGTDANDRADRLLDELIALLRLLMPGGSSPDDREATTVEHELATAVAYLRVHDACAGASREIDVAIDADAAARPLPPMLILPIARAIARHEGTVRAPLRIRARCADGRLTVEFGRDAEGDEPLIDPGELVKLRRRLDEGFDTDTASSVALDSAATLTVHLPLRP